MGNALMVFLVLIITFLPIAPVTDVDEYDDNGTIIAPQIPLRVAFVGNSLTKSGPIYTWTGQWGMAATQPDRDYVHRTQLMLAAQTGRIPAISVSVADFNLPGNITDAAQKLTTFVPDVLVVQMGDNAPTGTGYAAYRDAYATLRDAAPGATLVYVGIWREPDRGDDHVRRVANEDGAAYVEIHDLFLDANNQATAQGCTDTNGVCWHPSDNGMALIAARVVAAITRGR